MSEEESDGENPQIFIQHKPNWRSDGNFTIGLKMVFNNSYCRSQQNN